MNTSRKKKFFSVLSLSIMMSMLCILGCSCSKQIQWKSAENHQASLIDGLSIYIDHQTSKASANVLKIIVVNNSVEDIAICETDEAVLQKLNGSQWQVIDPGERQSTSALKTFPPYISGNLYRSRSQQFIRKINSRIVSSRTLLLSFG